MTNIQLAQKFASDTLFEKLHKVPLSSWVHFAKVFNKLSDEHKEEVLYVVNKVSEWREMEKDIETKRLV